MRSVPAAAYAYVLGAVLGTLWCVLPALRAPTSWTTLGLLAALYALCELPGHCPYTGDSLPVRPGSFFPVLLAAAFLLPPAAAALVAVPGALLSRVDRRPAAVRRIWRAAQLALATWAAARTYALLGVDHIPGPPDFPYALLPAAAGALAFCLVLGLLECGVLASAERLPPRSAWRSAGAPGGPAGAGRPGGPGGPVGAAAVPYLVHGLAGLMMAVLWRSPYGPVSAVFVLLPMYISCWLFAQYHRESAAHRATIRSLVQAVDIKDRYTRGHGERVGRASVLIARELRMDEERLEAVRFAGILHDVGKLGVPTRILRKDGPLTPHERRVIELHPEYGHEITRGIGFLREAREAILHHHERLDGTGYPHGLAGDAIPEFARVVAVADAFDAMTSTRSYSRARPVPVALKELERCAGAQFDPRMVTALVRALARDGWETAVTSDEPLLPPQRDGAQATAAVPRHPAAAPGPDRSPGPRDGCR
ncbi:HD-GYP domain-containing protein [Streptomyces qinzhouensis]|uniref:HD-GYP domain-containing protein n=1 Tax=Streptomyces qinzhouensis TaxID=2599401 RepID=A0A5B8JF89_9ACTN|nr:HD-GYP domain-containing protein [Streptomyces qinzhouensis]QDY78944.1 HD-GYP domain-containing protein [Streptomyces qinzhouensis]